MALTYLKIEPEKAIIVLNQLLVSGYRLKDKLVYEYKELHGGSDYYRSVDGAVPPETRKGWTDQLVTWATDTFNELQNIYISPAEAYKFKEAQTLPLSSQEFDTRFYSQLLMLQARLDTLSSYKDFIFQHSPIQITAGRDAYVQTGNNPNAEVNN